MTPGIVQKIIESKRGKISESINCNMFGAEIMTGTTQLSLQRCNHTSVGT